MNFGITFNNSSYDYSTKTNGLDYGAIKETAQEIFGRAQSTSSNLNNIDLSKFNRADVGLDLYNGAVPTNVAKNISLQNAGQNITLNNEALANIQYLNMQAAQAMTESTVKTMEGKINPNPTEAVSKSDHAETPLPNSTTFFNTSNLSKDKQGGGNPFCSNSNNSTGSGNASGTSSVE